MKKLAIVLFATIWLGATASAQQIGDNVRPIGNLKAWNKTPGGLLDFSSKSFGEVSPRQTFKILETKAVAVAGGWDTWVKVQPTSNVIAGCPASGCWVYWGKRDGVRSNLVLAAR